ncbi:unnamed protein product [Pelagomonas calceolata]|uniref:Uncharacterized protein n=1 Tax=Pelagomonas calceolata TaxID=35677 RepID=A0A8J2X4C9_9STRA|nr:unnamed protein product [Pelagomonas calceolata]
MRFAEYLLPRPCDRLERLHGFADMVERGASIQVERTRVTVPHLERDSMPFSENASRHGHHFAHQSLGFCVAP